MDVDHSLSSSLDKAFRLREWTVQPALNQLERPSSSVHIEPKHMDVLVYLAKNSGDVQSKEQIFEAVWPQQYVTESALTRAIAELRRALDDDARNPRYIETVPKRGYRIIAEIGTPKSPEKEVSRPRWRGLMALALVLIATITWWLIRPTDRSATSSLVPPYRQTQITTSPAFDLFPNFSPDGRSLVYCSDQTGTFELYVRQLASGGPVVALTEDGQDNIQPVWSPDGNWIAYHSIGRGGIWMIPSFGGQPTQISAFGSAPAWSPDGSLIAFESHGPWLLNQAATVVPLPGVIWVVEPSGSAPRQITQKNQPWGGHGAPTFSPDSKEIFFSNRIDIWSVRLSDATLKFYPQRGSQTDPVVAPDGKMIYFLAKLRNDNWLCRMAIDVDRDELRQEVLVNIQARHLDLSPDGKTIALSLFDSASNLWSVRLDPASGSPVADPSALTAETNLRNTLPWFSPDGEVIAFSRFSRGTRGSIWSISADGGDQKELLARPGVNYQFPQWSEDGTALYVSSRRAFHRFDLETRRLEEHARIGPGWSQAGLSPDGNQWVIVRQINSVENIWIADIDGSNSRQITFDPEYASWPNWSPDGRWIAFEMGREGHTYLAIVPSEGGEVRQLTFEPEHSWPYNGWSADGSKIAFAGSRGGVWNIFWTSIEDGSSKQLTDHEGNRGSFVRYPAWSPKGDQIVYERTVSTADVWFLDLGR